MIVKAVINDTLGDKMLAKLREVATSLAGLVKSVKALRRTGAQELMTYQINAPGTVGDGVNHKNKDGVLALGDDGRCLHNVRVRTDGTLVVSHDQPVEVVPHLTEVVGTVSVEDTVTVEPVTVANMPTEIKVQEGLHVIQVPPEVQILPFNFSESLEATVIPGPCRVYSLYLSVCDPTQVEIPGIVGSIKTTEFHFNIYPSSIELDRLVINCIAYHNFGGYVVYQPCEVDTEVREEVKEEWSIKDMMKRADERKCNDTKSTASKYL